MNKSPTDTLSGAVRYVVSLGLLLNLTGCDLFSPATDRSKTEDKAKLDRAIRNSLQEPGHEVPGVSMFGNFDDLKLRDAVSSNLSKIPKKIEIVRQTSLDYDVTNGLAPLENKELTRNLTKLSLYNFPIDDKILESIKDLKLVDLDLSNTKIKDAHALRDMKTLVHLGLSQSPLNLEGMNVIGGLTNLETLTLNFDTIPDDYLAHLSGLKQLRRLTIVNCTNLTNAGVDKLRKSLPKCAVFFVTGGHKKVRSETPVLERVDTMLDLGQTGEADEVIVDQVARWEQQPKPNYVWLARGYLSLARCKQMLKDKVKALAAYKRSTELFKTKAPGDAFSTAAYMDYANALDNDGQYAEAIKYRNQALRLRRPVFNSIRNNVDNIAIDINNLTGLGGDYQRLHQWKQAEAAYLEAYGECESARVTDSLGPSCLIGLGEVYLAEKSYAKALVSFKKAEQLGKGLAKRLQLGLDLGIANANMELHHFDEAQKSLEKCGSSTDDKSNQSVVAAQQRLKELQGAR